MIDKIGGQLRDIRTSRGLTQAAMADLLDIPLTTYQNYEMNKSRVDSQKVMEFAAKLNVKVQEFYPETTAFTQNNHDSGQGGGVNFGTQNFYLGDNVVNSALTKENEELRGEINELKSKLQEFMERFPKNE
jgi:transcriptional regulator with XRE-family HTH domain